MSQGDDTSSNINPADAASSQGTGSQSDTHGIAGGNALWHGRFADGPADELMAFTESISYDQRLIDDDIFCSQAHVRGLARAGILTEIEAADVIAALDTVGTEFHAGTLTPLPSDEDIHTLIERRVTEIAGQAGAKLHTGRSRNDQVTTATRRYTKRALTNVAHRTLELIETLVSRAEEAGTDDNAVYLPGYTHLQQAQPVLLAHHLLAHAWALLRDIDRIHDTVVRMDVSPLGAGALAGSSLGLDPTQTARDAGFAATFDNSLDATSDRDYVAESLFVLSLLAVHLSRMGEEIVLWTTEEFSFATLDDAYATGSSMLPQKKNPDIAELARGKTGRVIGNLSGFLATLKSLPLAYNRDLQEDKEPLFDSLDTLLLGLGAMNGLYATLRFNPDRMQRSADSPYGVATDLAEFLVARGMAFRDAHAVVGELVRSALESTDNLADLVAAHPDLGSAAVDLFIPGKSVQNRRTYGGAGPVPVSDQLARIQTRIQAETTRFQS